MGGQRGKREILGAHRGLDRGCCYIFKFSQLEFNMSYDKKERYERIQPIG